MQTIRPFDGQAATQCVLTGLWELVSTSPTTSSTNPSKVLGALLPPAPRVSSPPTLPTPPTPPTLLIITSTTPVYCLFSLLAFPFPFVSVSVC